MWYFRILIFLFSFSVFGQNYYRTVNKKAVEIEEGDPIANRSPIIYMTPASIDPDVTTDGATISGNAWEDTSGNDFHATVGSGTMSLNVGSTGRQVEFDGGSYLTLPDDPLLEFDPSSESFSIVLRLGDVISTSNSNLIAKASSAALERMVELRVNSSSYNYIIVGGGGSNNISPSTMSANNLIIIISTPSGVNMWVDGTKVVNNGTVGSEFTSGIPWNIGARHPGSSKVSNGTNLDLFAIIPSALTTPQRLAIEAEYQIN